MNDAPLYLMTSHRGQPIVEINGIRLHSAYDPVKEADRFVSSSCNGTTPGTIILLGAETGYISTVIRQKYPQAKLLRIFYSQAVYELATPAAKSGWYPQAGGSTLLDYLRSNLHELDLKGLKILEWPASAAIYPDIAAAVNEQLSHFLKELSGSFFTSYTFGKLWIKNSFYNFIHLDKLFSLELPGTTRSVVIAGSGPSLADGINAIRAERENISLWALPSAALFLETNGIAPDFIVLTDPGYYSLYHLQCLAGTGTRIIMPLSAAAGMWQPAAPVAYLAQPAFFEIALLKFFGRTFPSIPPQGTVAATALELALQYTNQWVVTSGLDFCYRDIQSHVLPSPFSRYFEMRATRTASAYSQLYKSACVLAPLRDREKQTRTSRSLLTYAGWFNYLPAGKKQRIRKLHAGFTTNLQVEDITAGQFAALVRGKEERRPPVPCTGEFAPGSGRREYCLELLAQWKQRTTCAMQEGSAGNAADRFFSDKLLFDLSYYIDLDKLNKAWYFSRCGEQARFSEVYAALLDVVYLYLETLQNKIGNNGG